VNGRAAVDPAHRVADRDGHGRWIEAGCGDGDWHETLRVFGNPKGLGAYHHRARVRRGVGVEVRVDAWRGEGQIPRIAGSQGGRGRVADLHTRAALDLAHGGDHTVGAGQVAGRVARLRQPLASYPFRFAATSQSKIAFDAPPRSSATVKPVAVFSLTQTPLQSPVRVTCTRIGWPASTVTVITGSPCARAATRFATIGRHTPLRCRRSSSHRHR